MCGGGGGATAGTNAVAAGMRWKWNVRGAWSFNSARACIPGCCGLVARVALHRFHWGQVFIVYDWRLPARNVCVNSHAKCFDATGQPVVTMFVCSNLRVFFTGCIKVPIINDNNSCTANWIQGVVKAMSFFISLGDVKVGLVTNK